MAKGGQKIFVIRTEAHFDALCSPVRAAILESLLAFGPMPAREIAERVGRKVTLTHHHLGILVEAGMVAEGEKRKKGRHLERVFELIPEDFRFDFDAHPKVAAKGIMRVARTFSRFTERMLGQSLKGGWTDRMKEHATFRSETARLRPESALEVRAHLLEIRRIFERERLDKVGDPFQIFWSFFPLSEAKGESAPVRKKRKGKES
jgi:DNA-binding transcriptional ArsR family regulator